MLFTFQLLSYLIFYIALLYFIWILFGWFTGKYALVRNTLLVCVCRAGEFGVVFVVVVKVNCWYLNMLPCWPSCLFAVGKKINSSVHQHTYFILLQLGFTSFFFREGFTSYQVNSASNIWYDKITISSFLSCVHQTHNMIDVYPITIISYPYPISNPIMSLSYPIMSILLSVLTLLS